MSNHQLSSFLKAVLNDVSLQEKIKAAEEIEDIQAIVKESGFDVSPDEWSLYREEWQRYQSKEKADLSDDELAKVAGGMRISAFGVEVEFDAEAGANWIWNKLFGK